MREIKFIWVCRNIKFDEIERVELTDEKLLSGYYPSWITSGNCEVIAKILPTGLKDKYGKEIYEGDIVRWFGHEAKDGKQIRPERLFIVIDEIENLYRLNNIVTNARGLLSPQIIGNIYENPEMVTT